MIFISHDFEDIVSFQNVADACDAADIAYFPPETIRTGADLSLELKRVIQSSEACVFVATRKSVHSQWCLAELGAFWGSGKPVLVFYADEQLGDRDLPPYLHGTLYERRIKKIVDSAKALLAETRPTPPSQRRVGDLTLPELHEVLAASVQFAQTSSLVSFNFLRLADLLRSGRVEKQRTERWPPYMEHEPRILPDVKDLLNLFLGVPEAAARNVNTVPWRYRALFTTTAGNWLAFSTLFEDVAGLEVMQECILFRLENGRVVTVAMVGDIRDFSYAGTSDPATFSVGTPEIIVGTGEVGKAIGSING